jgi:hypothetical protein
MRLRITLPLGSLLLTLTACNAPQYAPAPAQAAAAPASATPAWVDSEEVPDGLAAVGISQPNAMGDKGMQRTVAVADARAKLAGKLKVRVRSMFTQLNQQVTTASAETGAKPIKRDVMNRVIENVTRQLVDQELVGASTRATWTDPSDGSLYLFLVMPREAVNQSLANTAKTEIRREIAKGETTLKPALPKVDQAVVASDTEDKLNADLDKLDPTAPPVH